jgi:protein Mpv17
MALLKVNWSIWLPASFVGFRFVPTHWRIPYVSCVSFCWNCVFSRMQGSFRAREEQQKK